MDAPGIGFVRADRRRTFASVVVAARVGVVEVGVLPKQFGIGEIGITVKLTRGISKRKPRSAACPAGIFPLGFGRQAIAPVLGQVAGFPIRGVQVFGET